MAIQIACLQLMGLKTAVNENRIDETFDQYGYILTG
jgi:hypothetical protein